MAIELTRQHLRSALGGRGASRRLSPKLATAILTLLVLAAFISALVGLIDAVRREDRASAHLADANAILALPAGSSAELRSQLAVVNTQVAMAQATPSTAVSADELTASLVRTAAPLGFTVKGVTRLADAEQTIDGVAYRSGGIRITGDGSVSAVLALLAALRTSAPVVVPALNALNIDPLGGAHADLSFTLPVAAATPTAVARRPAR